MLAFTTPRDWLIIFAVLVLMYGGHCRRFRGIHITRGSTSHDNNVSLETDAADNWKPLKKKSRERIDGIVGLIMGLGIMLENSEPAEPDFYIFY